MILFRLIGWCAVFLGGGLLLLNASGWVLPLRNTAMYSDPALEYKNDVSLSYQEFLEKEKALPKSPRAPYVKALTQLVSQSMAHLWSDPERFKYRLHVPAYENFILYVGGYLMPERYRMYEYVRWKKALERGAGACSQHAIIIKGILDERNIPASIIGLHGHVANLVQISESPETWRVVDADYGVVVEHSLEAIEKKTALINPYYQAAGFGGEYLTKLNAAYAAEGNLVLGKLTDYTTYGQVRSEISCYGAKW